MKKLYVTIDTEMDSDIHWKKNFPPEYTSVTDGIRYFLRPIWDKYQVHPIYFVSPEVLMNEECCKILKEEVTKGAIIGAHLHPEYIEPDKIWGDGMNQITPKFPCSAYSTEIESEKLKNLTNMIEVKLGTKPIWYRAARFGADLDTIRILQKLGYKYDSSITPCIDWSSKGGPNHKKAQIMPYMISKFSYYTPAVTESEKTGIYEYPVTICGKRFGIFGKLLPSNWLFYKWLRPTHMTYIEQKHLIRQAVRCQQNCLVMMFHSMEIMINKTPYVRTRWMQSYYLWRLEKTLKYAKMKGYEL